MRLSLIRVRLGFAISGRSTESACSTARMMTVWLRPIYRPYRRGNKRLKIINFQSRDLWPRIACHKLVMRKKQRRNEVNNEMDEI